jgi:hypothetical protein
MSNPHQEEAQRQLGMLEKLRERNIRERAGWGPTPLQAQQHQTGAATGLTFRIPVGKYQVRPLRRRPCYTFEHPQSMRGVPTELFPSASATESATIHSASPLQTVSRPVVEPSAVDATALLG